MLSWLRSRSRQGRHAAIRERVNGWIPATRGEVTGNRHEIARLKARLAGQEAQMAVLAAETAGQASPPPLSVTAAADSYCPGGRAVYARNRAGAEHVFTTNGLGDPQQWWDFINSRQVRAS